MKKMFFRISAIVISVVYLASCGGSKTIDNEFLGKFPSMEKNYAEKIAAKEEALEKAKNLNSAFKLSREIEEIKKERREKINEYLEKAPLEKQLPFEALEGTSYTINGVVVNSASAGTLKLMFDVTIDEDIKRDFGWGMANFVNIYYKALDKNGQEIPYTKSVAVNSDYAQLIAGTELQAFGTWFSNGVRNLENFAKIVEITKEEFESR
jgi:hypothetical protein